VPVKKVKENIFASEKKSIQVDLKKKVEAPVAAKTDKPEPTTT